MSALKILHVGNHTLPCVGGIENVIWQTAREQAVQGHAVEIMVFDTCTTGKKLPSLEKKDGVIIRRVPQAGFSFYRIPPAEALLACAREKDIIHIHGVGAWMDTLARNKNSLRGKLILTTHGGFFHTAQRKWLKWLYSTFWLPFSWKKMDGIIFVSESDREHFSFLKHDRTIVIENGIETDYARVSLAEKVPGMFLFVGRISKNKRVDQLIDAFAVHVESKHGKKSTLHIVGGDWEGLRTGLEARVEQKGLAGKVFFHGEVPFEQKLDFFMRASFLVSASEYEGFGISVLEAMASGCIPCLSPIPSFRVFAEDKRGKITDYSNPRAAGESWNELCSVAPAKMMAWRKRVRAYAHSFEWPIRVEELEKWYRTCLKK